MIQGLSPTTGPVTPPSAAKSSGTKKFELYTEKDVAQSVAREESEKIDLMSGDAQEIALVQHIRNAWYQNRRHKEKINNRLISCLEARKGEYSSGQLSELRATPGADPIYLKLTATKCRAASAWIRDVVMPTGDRSFSVQPTSIPSLPVALEQSAREAAKQEAISLMQLGVLGSNMEDVVDFIAKTRDKALKQINKEAMKRADRMEDKISDLMDEGEWDNSFEEFIEDFVTYPAAFLKGPFLTRKRTLKWAADNTPRVEEELLLGWKRISPFDAYPAPYARTLQEGNFIEHIRFDKPSLYNLIGMPGYDEDNIRGALAEYQLGGLREWMWRDWERLRLENSSPYYYADVDTIDAVHYWGWVPGKLLKEWGVKHAGLEEEKPYPVDAVLIGRYIIRAEVNDDPIGQRPYHMACWDAVPGSIWGTGLPEQMDDHQKMVNACARALANNMALSSGPQATVMTDMLAENENIRSMYPFKIWQAKNSVLNTSNSLKPVEFWAPPSMAQELLAVLNQFEQKADDVTNVPRYSYGNEKIGGAGSTASGLSMLMNSAAKGIRRAIANIDMNIIRPSIRQAFNHIMLYDPDESLKGDCEIVPRGATSILIKEQNLVRIQSFLNITANPFDMQIIGIKGRAKLLHETGILMDLDMDGIVPSDDEIEEMEAMQKMQQQQQQAAAPPNGTPESPESDQAALPGNKAQAQQNKLEGPTQAGG